MLDRAGIRAIAWSVLGTIGQQVSAFGILLLLTRQLDPAAFGIAALAFAIFDLLQLIVKAGLAETLTRSRSLNALDLSTAFWTSTALGIVLAALLLTAAPSIANSLGLSALSDYLKILAVGLVIAGLAPVYEALMLRDMRFKAMAHRNIGGTLSAGLVAVVLALSGFGAMALIAQRLVYTAWSLMVAIALTRWSPILQWHKPTASRQLHAGRAFTLASFLGMGNQRIVDLIIGASLGPTALGYLRIAWRAFELLLDLTVGSVNRVMLPALSRTASKPTLLFGAYNHGLTLTAIFAYPLFSGAAIVAPDAIPLLFGAQWQPSIVLVQLLATSALFIPLIYFKSTILFVVDKLATIIWLNVFEFLLSIAIALFTAQISLAAAAYGNTIRMAIATPVIMYIVSRTTGVASSASCAGVLKPLYATTLMTVALAVLLHIVPTDPMIRLPIMITTGAAIYGISLRLLTGPALWSLFGLQPQGAK